MEDDLFRFQVKGIGNANDGIFPGDGIMDLSGEALIAFLPGDAGTEGKQKSHSQKEMALKSF